MRSKYDLREDSARARRRSKFRRRPPAPDFEKLAKENGLSSGRTKLLSQWEAQDTDIGAID